MSSLGGTRALVSGAASGIGAATACAAARAGAAVICLDRDDAQATVRSIEVAGGTARAVIGDVRRADDWAAAVAAAAEFGGPVDLLANVAGIAPFSSLLETSEADWDAVLDVNLKGVWLGMRAVLPGMLGQRAGRIVNVSSAAGLVGAPDLSAYSAAKAGVNGLTRQAAVELAGQGVCVNAVAPGGVRTPIHAEDDEEAITAFAAVNPIPRLATAEEVAAGIVYFWSPEAAYVTGQVLAIDGGMTAA